jgi:ATP-dependent DNA helicase RecQ
MIRQDFVVLKEGTYSMLKITQKAVEILRGERRVLLLIKEEETALNPELYNILKVWRKERANRDSIKPYIIFSDATLIEIVNKLPKTREELFDIRGVGEKKVERYGEEVLKIINMS